MNNLFIKIATCSILMGCSPAPISPVAPTIIQVEGVEAESLSDEAPYVPTVKWTVWVYNPDKDLEIWGATENTPNGDRHIDPHVWTWGPMTASTSLEGNQIRLDCSNGSVGLFTCLNNDATMRATCERMIFKFTCTRM